MKNQRCDCPDVWIGLDLGQCTKQANYDVDATCTACSRRDWFHACAQHLDDLARGAAVCRPCLDAGTTPTFLRAQLARTLQPQGAR